MFNFFEELFAPGRKHTAEEQRRLELTRVDLGVGDPARGPIDLTSGKVVVRRRDEDGDGGPGEPDGDGDEPDGGSGGDGGGGSGGDGDGGDGA
ncbi:hypothetical protein JGS39_14895 [Streptomyces sp. P01-B04]|uniref:DUF6191 domain-containing protein n=1 Tax=Streptomyces poriferorum TaxID=2798799 RepID=UPI001C5D8AD8|nr:DUF6191 domain-containing protein [Streptomyces poriferorum]MBW5250265.1 hypothetical protein [Streptomyces poriferorum]MBW5259951.1 hypothetical protein [Streptomyces poriferorum]